MTVLKPLINEKKNEVFQYLESFFSKSVSCGHSDIEAAKHLVKRLYKDMNLAEPLILVCESPWIPLSLSFAWSHFYGMSSIEQISKSNLVDPFFQKMWANTLDFCKQNNAFSSVEVMDELDPGYGSSSDSPFLPNRSLEKRILKKHGQLLKNIEDVGNYSSDKLDYFFLQNMIEEEFPTRGSVTDWVIYSEIYRAVLRDLVDSVYDYVRFEEFSRMPEEVEPEANTIRGFNSYNIIDWANENRFNPMSGLRLMIRRILLEQKELDQNIVIGNFNYGIDLRFVSSFQLILPYAQEKMILDLLGKKYLSDAVHPGLEFWTGLAKSASAYKFFDQVCFICLKPSAFSMNEESNYHHEAEAAIEFSDGYKQYYLQGRKVPEYVIENPESITVELVDKESNVEVRRIMIERYGLERFLKDSGAQIVSQDSTGTLYKRQDHLLEPLTVVEVTNSTSESDGTFKKYFLRVPPEMETAKQAVAWTFGLAEHEYSPEIES